MLWTEVAYLELPPSMLGLAVLTVKDPEKLSQVSYQPLVWVGRSEGAAKWAQAVDVINQARLSVST